MAGPPTALKAASKRLPSERAPRLAALPQLAGAAAFAPLALGMGAWLLSISQTKLSSVGLYGLLRSVSLWFFVGAFLVVAGFVVELARVRPRQWVLGLHIVALIFLIHASVPMLSHAPEYEWVYKHIGVAQTLRADGRVTDSQNIYQEWPALFTAVGAISSEAGVGLLSIARWAPLAFELLDCLMILAIFRLLTRDGRISMLGVALFEIISSWIGQDYLSPQAFAFVLWLGFVYIVLRWLLVTGGPDAKTRGPRWFAWLRRYLTRGLDTIGPPSDTRVRAVAVIAALVIFTAIVVSHQLTPYAGLCAIGALTILDMVRPRWLLIATTAIAILFLIPRYGLISSQYGGIFSGFDILQNASGTGAQSSAAQAFTANAVRLLAVGTWLSTAIVVLRARRSAGRVILPALLAATPFVVIVGQSYGGEAIYRVFLFSAPWCSLLLADAIYRWRSQARRFAVTLVVMLAALVLSLQGLYGPVAVDTFSQAEVTGGLWLYAHSRPGSQLIMAADNFPLRDVANTQRYTVEAIPDDPQAGVDGDYLGATDLHAIDKWVAGSGKPSYLVFSKSMLTYAGFYNAPKGIPTLLRKVEHTPSAWRRIYSQGDVKIFRFIG